MQTYQNNKNSICHKDFSVLLYFQETKKPSFRWRLGKTIDHVRRGDKGRVLVVGQTNKLYIGEKSDDDFNYYFYGWCRCWLCIWICIQ